MYAARKASMYRQLRSGRDVAWRVLVISKTKHTTFYAVIRSRRTSRRKDLSVTATLHAAAT